MIVGDADSQYNSNVNFRNHLVSLGIDPQFQVLAGVSHDQAAYANNGAGLTFLSDHFASVFRRAGDYDRNGAIDANDYAIWRGANGSTALLQADGNGNGVVDTGDYVLWRKAAAAAAAGQFAQAASAAVLLSAVPEPAMMSLVAMVLASWLLARPHAG
jgi:hypothetical protein